MELIYEGKLQQARPPISPNGLPGRRLPCCNDMSSTATPYATQAYVRRTTLSSPMLGMALLPARLLQRPLSTCVTSPSTG